MKSDRTYNNLVRVAAATGLWAAVAIASCLIALVGGAAAQSACLLDSGGASAFGGDSFACGDNAVAVDGGTSVGESAGLGANGEANTAVGNHAGFSVNGGFNTATGAGAGLFVTGSDNSAFGAIAGQYVTGSGNIAIGQSAGSGVEGDPLTMSNAISIGANAVAGHDNAMAIGSAVTTTRANQVALGSAANTYTLAGIASSDSLAAQTGPVVFTTADSAGNLAISTYGPSDIGTLYSTTTALDMRLTNTESQIGSLDGRVSALEGAIGDFASDFGKAFEGTAIALAMAGGGLPSDKNYALSINWGAFEGENGFAGSAAARINENMFIHGGIGVGASHGTVGGRAGMTFAW